MKLLAATALAVLFAFPLLANPKCMPRELLLSRLADTYGETRQSVGLSSAGMMEVFASEENGTWTITITVPSGPTCLVASGESYENINERLVTGDPL